ncbi:MAG: hypothetical protein L6R45_10155 [Anaerolineae bacterium]|nr:hypothetical protein [Anaerolineae bacterium]
MKTLYLILCPSLQEIYVIIAETDEAAWQVVKDNWCAWPGQEHFKLRKYELGLRCIGKEDMGPELLTTLDLDGIVYREEYEQEA